MENITEQRIALLHPKLRAEAMELVNNANSILKVHSQVRVVQSIRTFAEQAALYAQGRTTAGKIVTNAKAGQSIHNYGLAIDFALLIDDKVISWDTHADFNQDGIPDWLEVVKVFTDNGWVWGGTWKSIKDYPHLEKSFGLTWEALLTKYNAGDTFVDTNGQKYVNI
jgi:peptidoglycan L-alanyl-D-glutamate endopeptidase CwlK